MAALLHFQPQRLLARITYFLTFDRVPFIVQDDVHAVVIDHLAGTRILAINVVDCLIAVINREGVNEGCCTGFYEYTNGIDILTLLRWHDR